MAADKDDLALVRVSFSVIVHVQVEEEDQVILAGPGITVHVAAVDDVHALFRQIVVKITVLQPQTALDDVNDLQAGMGVDGIIRHLFDPAGNVLAFL